MTIISIPSLLNDDYDVVVRVLHDPRGILLIESPAETSLKYQELQDDARIALAAQSEPVLENRLKQLAAAEKQESELFALLETQRGSEFVSFTFTFRTASVEDHDAADSEANKVQPRQELTYRRVLATRCLKKNDYPGFESFGKMRTDVALHLLRAVSERLTFSSDIRGFTLPPAEGLAAA